MQYSVGDKIINRLVKEELSVSAERMARNQLRNPFMMKVEPEVLGEQSDKSKYNV